MEKNEPVTEKPQPPVTYCPPGPNYFRDHIVKPCRKEKGKGNG